jgi:hypothetical protein
VEDLARFREVDAARETIDKASPAAFKRWTDAERPKVAGRTAAEYAAERALVLGRASSIYNAHVELASHPLHFRNFRDSAGMILSHKDSVYFMRPTAEGNAEVILGNSYQPNKTNSELFSYYKGPFANSSRDVHNFLQEHDSFDQEPGSILRLFLDGQGGLQIYDEDFNHLIDASDRLQERQQAWKALPPEEKALMRGNNLWIRTKSPLLLTVASPEPNQDVEPIRNTIAFESSINHRGRERRLSWQLAYVPSGSFATDTFASDVVHASSGPSYQAQLTGANQNAPRLPFSLQSFPPQRLFEHDSGYTPLLSGGNHLLLRSQGRSHQIATDMRVLTLLGPPARS